MKTTFSALTAVAFVCLAEAAQAKVIDTSALKLVGIVQTQGEYDNAGWEAGTALPSALKISRPRSQINSAPRSHSKWIAHTRTICMSWCPMCLIPTSVKLTAPLSNLWRWPG
jgi:hypothetical protein